MLLANWLDVPDAMAFLDAFAEAAEKVRGWKLDHIKIDYGHQFVYVRYTGRKFAGKGLMASAFAPVRQYGPSLALRVPMEWHRPLQRVNLTIRTEEWPTHVCFDQSAERLLAPLLRATQEAIALQSLAST